MFGRSIKINLTQRNRCIVTEGKKEAVEPLLSKLASVERRLQQIDGLLSDPAVSTDFEKVQKLAKERASIEGIVAMYREYLGLLEERKDAQALLREDTDQGLAALAREEMETLDGKLQLLKQDLRLALLPKDPNDEKSVIVEIREGVGGQEAGLFAADLYRMYTRYALLLGWTVEQLHHNPSPLGGIKEVVFEINGPRAFSRLKFERGAHRVQRVPVTEASGRIHTSTATVAVLPEADEVDVQISPEDVRIDIFHASGAGGQNVNKVATAVRMVHIPTGTVAVCQDERSQFKNKQKAMSILRARLYEAEQHRQDTQITQARRAQVGTGERAEKIRTYNFPQDRISDHRLRESLHGIQKLLAGEMDPLVDALASWEQEELLGNGLA